VTKFLAARDPEPAGEPAPGTATTCQATAGGIAQCLRMLADEAGSLGLTCTVRALWVAIAVCEHEAVHATATTLFAAADPVQTIAAIVSSVN